MGFPSNLKGKRWTHSIDIEINGGNAGAFRIMAWGGPQKNPR